MFNHKQLLKKLANTKRLAEIADSLAICERMLKKLQNDNNQRTRSHAERQKGNTP